MNHILKFFCPNAFKRSSPPPPPPHIHRSKKNISTVFYAYEGNSVLLNKNDYKEFCEGELFIYVKIGRWIFHAGLYNDIPKGYIVINTAEMRINVPETMKTTELELTVVDKKNYDEVRTVHLDNSKNIYKGTTDEVKTMFLKLLYIMSWVLHWFLIKKIH